MIERSHVVIHNDDGNDACMFPEKWNGWKPHSFYWVTDDPEIMNLAALFFRWTYNHPCKGIVGAAPSGDFGGMIQFHASCTWRE
jgi:hypothetical protein